MKIFSHQGDFLLLLTEIFPFPLFFSFLCLWSCEFVVLLCHLNSWKVSQYIWLSPKIVCNFLPLWFSIHLWQLYKKQSLHLKNFRGVFCSFNYDISRPHKRIFPTKKSWRAYFATEKSWNLLFVPMDFKINTKSIKWSILNHV